MSLGRQREATFARRMTIEVGLLIVVVLLILGVVAVGQAAPAGEAACARDEDCKAGASCMVVKTGCPGAEAYSTCAARRCVVPVGGAAASAVRGAAAPASGASR